MIQTSDHITKKWGHFLENTRNLILDYEILATQVKISPQEFLSDSKIIEYYEDVFCKQGIIPLRSTNDASRKKWHQQDKNLLIWCVAKHLLSQAKEELIPNETDWQYISELLDVEKQLLELKWIALLHSNLKITPWSKDEDQLLIEIANECYQKNNWTELTIKFNSKSSTQRYPKQIRERWNNVLNPQIQRTAWTQKEKLKLISLILQHGKKWSKIQDELQGRSENQIKNQYSSIIRCLKKYNVQEGEEKSFLRSIINNPEQQLNLIASQFISDLQAQRDHEKPKSIDSQVSNEPTKKVQIESGRTITGFFYQIFNLDLIQDIKPIETVQNAPQQKQEYQSHQFSTNYYQNNFQYTNYSNSYQNFQQFQNYYAQPLLQYPQYQYNWPQQQYLFPSYY